LAETIDRIAESDDVLRVAIGMPDRSQNTGSPALPIARSYTLALRFCTAASCAVLSALPPHVCYAFLLCSLFVRFCGLLLVRQ